jgi:hypothetical protein
LIVLFSNYPCKDEKKKKKRKKKEERRKVRRGWVGLGWAYDSKSAISLFMFIISKNNNQLAHKSTNSTPSPRSYVTT